MSYDPKTKIIELEKVNLCGDEFFVTTKEKEKLDKKENECNNLSFDKIKIITVIIVVILILAWAIWFAYNPFGAIGYTLLYGIPIILIKIVISFALPPKNEDLEYRRRLNNNSLSL